MLTLINKYQFCFYGILEDQLLRCYKPSLKVKVPLQSVLSWYFATGTLSQNEVGILLKWRRGETQKNSKF